MTRTIRGLAAMALVLGTAVSASAAAQKTVTDLKAAYLGETTASAKYAVYAKKAEAEGYKAPAALFRAASSAEKIHAANHKAALAKLGVKSVKAGAFTKPAGTTADNLKDAIKGETYEKDTMYPGMIKDAVAEKQPDATRSMTFALAAEKQHAALYTAALKSLKQKPTPAAFYVCPVCGATFTKAAPTACPVCGTPGSKFQRPA